MVTATKTAISKNNDRWDLIADRELGVAELGWAIAAVNPDLSGYLVLPAGLELVVPDATTLRRPLTAANPAREDDGDFLALPADNSVTVAPTGGGVVGNFVPLEAVGVTVAPLVNNFVPINFLPAYPTASSLDVVTNATYTAGLAVKADLSAVNTALALKADLSAVSSALALKADSSAVSTALGSKVDASTYTAGLALKADASALTSGLANKVDTSAYTAGLALKLDASLRNAASGVAGLDTNSLILSSQIPTFLQFQLIARAAVTPVIDLNNLTQNHASVRWIDGAAHTNQPSFLTTGGTLLQYDALFSGGAGVTNLWKTQEYIAPSGRVAERQQNNGTWGSWVERAYLNRSQLFTSLQDFTASATFKGGTTPAITTTLVQGGVDSSGRPVVWLVNASATAGNRLKSLAVASNGNIIFGHHADDGTAGVTVQLTTSGNLLADGTVRPGSGSSAFTGAQFVPGATFFRTDIATTPGVLVANSAGTVINSTGDLSYSDGERWRRLRDGTDTAVTSKIILSGTLPSSIAINTFTNFGTVSNAGLAFLETVWLISVYFQFSDASNTKAGHWQVHGAGILATIQWKAGGFQNAVSFPMSEHNAADYICSARFGMTPANRNLELAFDKALTFAGGANSYYRITLQRLL